MLGWGKQNKHLFAICSERSANQTNHSSKIRSKVPSIRCLSHLAAELQGGRRHLRGAQLHKGVPPLAVHGHIDHRVQPRHHLSKVQKMLFSGYKKMLN